MTNTAYWAKATHMRRMLEQHMDATTKAQMLTRCEAIDNNGLTYTQHGELKSYSHFDLTPLKKAQQSYIVGFADWEKNKNWTAMESAFMQIGIAQRDLPVHVVNEYCRRDRSFHPMPLFNEDNLPRISIFYNFDTLRYESLFPLVVSESSGCGVDFVLVRAGIADGCERVAGKGRGVGGRAGAAVDLAAIVRLDEVRTADLAQSLENLKPTVPGLGNEFRIS